MRLPEFRTSAGIFGGFPGSISLVFPAASRAAETILRPWITGDPVLGESLDTDSVEADYDQGVLTLRIPVAEAAKPRRVEVTKSGGGQPSIGEGRAARKS